MLVRLGLDCGTQVGRRRGVAQASKASKIPFVRILKHKSVAQNRRERGESEGSALSCVCGHTSVGENSHNGNFAGHHVMNETPKHTTDQRRQTQEQFSTSITTLESLIQEVNKILKSTKIEKFLLTRDFCWLLYGCCQNCEPEVLENCEIIILTAF